MSKKIIWTNSLEQLLLDACAELGCEWNLIQQIYFPEYNYYSLKNKYYKMLKCLPQFPELPSFDQITLSSNYFTTLPLKYNFQEKIDIIPKQMLNPVPREAFDWNYPQFCLDSDLDEQLNFL